MSDRSHEDTTRRLGKGDVKPQARYRRACLKVLNGPAAGRLLRLESATAHLGRGPTNDLILDDSRVSRVHARLERTKDSQIRLVDLQSTNGTTVEGEEVKSRVLCEGDQIVLGGSVILKFSYVDALEEQVDQQLYDHANLDALTGVLNRRALMARLALEVEAARGVRPLWVALLDADHFKSINDTLGHAAGDAVLAELPRRWGQVLRNRDLLGRYGGEEFVLVLPHLEPDVVASLLERLRLEICSRPIQVPVLKGTREVSVSVSLGAAELGPTRASPEELLKAADAALYEAKALGRNRVCLAPREPAQREQRRSPRLKCQLGVECRLEGRQFPVQLRDVGRTGLRLVADRPLPVGAEVELVVADAGEALRARVVWCRGRKQISMGLTYSDSQERLRHTWLYPFLDSLGFAALPAAERRFHSRQSVELLVGLKTPRGQLRGRLLDLSVRGAMLRCEAEVAPQERVELEIPWGEETLVVGYQVVYCQPQTKGFRWGVSFEGPGPREEGLLHKILGASRHTELLSRPESL